MWENAHNSECKNIAAGEVDAKQAGTKTEHKGVCAPSLDRWAVSHHSIIALKSWIRLKLFNCFQQKHLVWIICSLTRFRKAYSCTYRKILLPLPACHSEEGIIASFTALVLRLWLSRLIQELKTQDKAIVNPFPVIGMEMDNRTEEKLGSVAGVTIQFEKLVQNVKQIPF